MRKTLITVFMLLVGSLALTVATQSQDRPQTDEWSNPSSQNQMSRDHITITGCLQRGTTPDSYVLNNATPSSSSLRLWGRQTDQGQSQARADTEQGQGSMNRQDQNDQSYNRQMPSAEARAESSYVLIPDSNVDLKSHIGHKVEITGKMAGSDSGNWGSQRPSMPGGETSDSRSSSKTTEHPEIRVTSIKHLAETCP